MTTLQRAGRHMQPISTRANHVCGCCWQTATHIGVREGVAVTVGCEYAVRRWVR